MHQLPDIHPTMQEREEKNKGKKVYASPRLLDYGSVSKLTRGQNGSVPDGLSGMGMV